MKRQPAWVNTFRDSVADAGFADGWSLIERSERVQVQHSWLDPEGVRKKATAMLPIAWKKGCTADVIEALKFISVSMVKGNTLKQAVAVYVQQGQSADESGLGWDAAWERFKQHKITNDVSDERRFERNDGHRWKWIRQAMEGVAVQNASQLFELATYSAKADEKGAWIVLPPGAAGRKKKVQTVNQFLTFCCEELGWDADRWMPPRNYTKFIGKKASTAAGDGAAYVGRKMDAIPEAAIKPLLESFPDTPTGRKWRTAIGLLACFGLRPWKLHIIEVDNGWLRVTQGKKNQKQSEPRIVAGLDPEGMPGLSQQLLAELVVNGIRASLPGIGTHPDQTACRCNYQLERMPYWRELKATCKAKGEQLASYSFRHRYAYRADEVGFNDRDASQFMGNKRETFVKHYGNKSGEDELRAKALRVLGNATVAIAGQEAMA